MSEPIGVVVRKAWSEARWQARSEEDAAVLLWKAAIDSERARCMSWLGNPLLSQSERIQAVVEGRPIP